MRLTLMGSLCEYLAALAEHADNSREAVKPDSERTRSVSGQRSNGSGDLARKTSVDFVTDKYSKEDLV